MDYARKEFILRITITIADAFGYFTLVGIHLQA
jgi:hypothetical protein